MRETSNLLWFDFKMIKDIAFIIILLFTVELKAKQNPHIGHLPLYIAVTFKLMIQFSNTCRLGIFNQV